MYMFTWDTQVEESVIHSVIVGVIRCFKKIKNVLHYKMFLKPYFFTILSFLYPFPSFISVDPYRITQPLDMENGYNNTECANNYNIRGVSVI
jgi:hypothetical protein